MANMTIYAKENKIWDEAKDKAKEQGISFSNFVERAVTAYVHADSVQTKLDKIQAILNNDEPKYSEVKDDDTQYCDHACKECDDKIIAELDRMEKEG